MDPPIKQFDDNMLNSLRDSFFGIYLADCTEVVHLFCADMMFEREFERQSGIPWGDLQLGPVQDDSTLSAHT